MRIVLDTNVIVSGFLSTKGPPSRILGLAVEGVICLCLENRIVREYERVLMRPEWSLPASHIRNVLNVLYAKALWVEPPPLNMALPDPDDLMFVETAVAAEAEVLVTGNRRHFPKKPVGNVAILSPAEFIEHLRVKGITAETREYGK